MTNWGKTGLSSVSEILVYTIGYKVNKVLNCLYLRNVPSDSCEHEFTPANPFEADLLLYYIYISHNLSYLILSDYSRAKAANYKSKKIPILHSLMIPEK